MSALQVKRNCGLPQFGGADHTKTEPVVRFGKEPINPDNPDGGFRVIHTLTECPVSYVSDDSEEYLEIYALHQRFGGLPYQGTYLEQPAVLIEALGLIKSEVDLFNEQEPKEPKPKKNATKPPPRQRRT